MTIKNNDDVIHLLSVTGNDGSNYRSFGNAASGSGTAPLIDAVFAETPSAAAAAPIRRAAPAGTIDNIVAIPRSEAPRPAVFRPPLSKSGRSLAELRQILSAPAPADPKSTNGLEGLLARLAR
jgi:hypothetical protein